MSSAGLTIVANVAIATSPALLGGPAVLCVKFVLYDIQGYIVEFRCLRKTLRKGALYLTHDAETLFAESKFARKL